jgi:hypothetical protein
VLAIAASMSASLRPAFCAFSLAARWRSWSACTGAVQVIERGLFRRELGRFLLQLLVDFRNLSRDGSPSRPEVRLQPFATLRVLCHLLRNILAPRFDDADRLLGLGDSLLQIRCRRRPPPRLRARAPAAPRWRRVRPHPCAPASPSAFSIAFSKLARSASSAVSCPVSAPICSVSCATCCVIGFRSRGRTRAAVRGA